MDRSRDQFRVHSYREYRLIWWRDRATEALTLSAVGFVLWCIAGFFWPRLFNGYWIAFIVWMGGCVASQHFTKRRYYEKSVNQDPPTSRSMYKSVFIDKAPQRWHAATKAAGVYDGKTVSECDANYFRECNKPFSFFQANRSRLTEWRLSKRALRKVTGSTPL